MNCVSKLKNLFLFEHTCLVTLMSTHNFQGLKSIMFTFDTIIDRLMMSSSLVIASSMLALFFFKKPWRDRFVVYFTTIVARSFEALRAFRFWSLRDFAFGTHNESFLLRLFLLSFGAMSNRTLSVFHPHQL